MTICFGFVLFRIRVFKKNKLKQQKRKAASAKATQTLSSFKNSSGGVINGYIYAYLPISWRTTAANLDVCEMNYQLAI